MCFSVALSPPPLSEEGGSDCSSMISPTHNEADLRQHTITGDASIQARGYYWENGQDVRQNERDAAAERTKGLSVFGMKPAFAKKP